jgi:phosphinothricin acetyltransferase
VSVRVRDADPARDGAACAAVYAPYVLGSAASFEEMPPSAAEMSARIARLQPTHPWLVAEDDGAVVGYAYASPHHPRAGYRWAADVAVYVDAAHHRTGVGRRLYEALLGRLRAQGFQIACAIIVLPNPGSVGLHESLGFEPVGVWRRIGWKNGAWHDVGWWQLDIGDRPAPPPEPLPPPGP